MSFTNETTHYGLPQWIGSDKPTYLVDQNNAYQKIDSEIYNANVAAGQAVTTAEGAVSTAGSAASSAAEALSTAQTASSTADNALSEAQTANTNAQSAQTAAGAAQTAAEAAQTAAAGNSITNLAPAYDPTITYNIDDLVTAEGKLYKCIVAIVTPEQFDINKWDDVTTSEVYLRGGKYRLVTSTDLTITSDSTKTNKQFVEDAVTTMINNIKQSLNAGEFAKITFVDFLNHMLAASTTMFIDSNTTELYVEVCTVGHKHNGVGIDLLNIVYLNNECSISAATIGSDSVIAYEDLNSVTNSTNIRFIYEIYSNR